MNGTSRLERAQNGLCLHTAVALRESTCDYYGVEITESGRVLLVRTESTEFRGFLRQANPCTASISGRI